MTQSFYLRPIAFTDFPQTGGGAAVRLAGGMTYATDFALIVREGGRVVSRQSFGVRELEAALPDMPDEVRAQWGDLRRARPALACGECAVPLDRPQVIGILNVTPDSFSDGGAYADNLVAARDHAAAMIAAGAAMIDVGGESTRPGADPVAEADELRRVVPVVEQLAKLGAMISVDTRRPGVMAAALQAGAHVFNDVSALRHDPRSMAFAASSGAPVVLMHAPGPSTDTGSDDLHASPAYADVVLDVFDWLRERRDAALAAGVARDRIVLDPGIGFGKSLAENLALMNALPLFHALGQPLLLGASRKRMIGVLAGADAPAHQRLGGSLALALKGVAAGVQLLRVHDVAETVQAMRVWLGLHDAARGEVVSRLP